MKKNKIIGFHVKSIMEVAPCRGKVIRRYNFSNPKLYGSWKPYCLKCQREIEYNETLPY